MPGRDRHTEPEFLTKRLLDLKSLVAERRQRTGRAGELAHQHARLQLGETFGVTVEHRQIDRGLVAEGHRQRLLQMGAPGHRRVAITRGEIGQDTAECSDIRLDDLEAGADLQDYGGIHDVLRGRTPMHITASVAALLYHLVHQRQDRITDNVGFAAQQVEIEGRDVGAISDFLGGFDRDHSAARFGLGQRDLDFGIARDQAEIRKHRAHRRRAEGVAKQDGVEDGGRGRESGHVVSCRQIV